ncbi:L dopachrome tautomerase [Trichuris trichiura]|uniref:L dopachrome tautomerase n=1 Tax=Trichuris trichiura TaxID=36087 RepID=A0A077ZFE0_TRITR|nr:L dopachrome tautomerase [Trichuris trichiura]
MPLFDASLTDLCCSSSNAGQRSVGQCKLPSLLPSLSHYPIGDCASMTLSIRMRRYWSVEFLLFLLLLVVRDIQAQVPRECASEGILHNRVFCCPIPEGFTEPCGGPARGKCHPLEEINRNTVGQSSTAPRLNTVLSEWPNSVFSSVCVCHGLFAGYKCNECAPGYTGPNCEKRHETKRRKWYQHLGDQELDQLIQAFHLAEYVSSDYLTVMPMASGSIELKQLTVLEHFIWMYHMAGAEGCFGVGYRNYGALPTWNRAFIFHFEKALAQLIRNDTFALPYWFWFLSNDSLISRMSNASLFAESELRVDHVNICQTWAARLKPLCDMCSKQRKMDDRQTDEDMLNATRSFLKQMASELDDSDIKKKLSFILHQTIYVRESDGFADELNAFIFQGRGPVVGLLLNFTKSDRAKAVIRHLFKFPDSLSAESPLYYLALTGLDWLFERWIQINKPSLGQISYYAARGQNKFDPIVPFFPTQSHADFFASSNSLGYCFEKIKNEQMITLPIFLIIMSCILLFISGAVMIATGFLAPIKWQRWLRKLPKEDVQAPLMGSNVPTIDVKEAQSNGGGENSPKDEAKSDHGQPVGHEKHDIPHMDETTPRSGRN